MRDFDPTASEFISSGYINKSVPGSGAFYDPVSIATSIAIGAGSQLLSGAIGGKGAQQSSGILANSAMQGAQASAQGNENATANLYAMENTTRQDYSPYMQQGKVALSSLMGKINSGQLGGSFTGADYLANKDPGYDFQLQQGNQALQNSQAARDGVMSGPAMKGLIDYNQGMASTGYQNAYNRWLSSQGNTYNQLAGVAGIGKDAAAAGAGNAQKFSSGIGETMLGRGNSLAAGQVGAANNYSKAVDGIGSQMYALSGMAPQNSSNGQNANSDTGFNGQNNPTNQAALDQQMMRYS